MSGETAFVVICLVLFVVWMLSVIIDEKGGE
jgi:uncharacterized membrane protein